MRRAPSSKLVTSFWRLIPERVAAITEFWLGYEQADPVALRELKRLLHTIKGEAHMLEIPGVARLLRAGEKLVQRGEAIQATVAFRRAVTHAAAATLIDPDTLRAAATRRQKAVSQQAGHGYTNIPRRK